ncbi:MAG: carboxypeptidase regulatory-like domain-containing protein [Candidatus Acidiferrales bacterium]
MTSQGTVTVTVFDQQGNIVQGAKLELTDTASNELHAGDTMEAGNFNFVGLPSGKYRLSVSKLGFKNSVVDGVVVELSRTTDLKVTLEVGQLVEKVVVSVEAMPLVETTSSALASTIDMKQIEGLPLEGRDISSLAFLAPGFTGTPGNGTWNGLPLIAQGNNIDGVLASTSRMKFAGNAAPGLQARLEGIEEMTVQTGQTDLSQGLGTSSMQVNFVTRRGTNDYHGRIFEDFRNTVLDANSWFNKAVSAGTPPSPRTPIILNDFGGSVGGHILRDKLFFFGSFASSKEPGGYTATAGGNTLLSATAQQGIYTTLNTPATTTGPAIGTQINVFQIAQGCPSTACSTPLPTSVNSNSGGIANEIALVNKNVASGTLAPINANLNSISWLVHSPVTTYFPAARVDYNITQKLKLNFSLQMTKINQPGASAPPLPGSDFASQGGLNKSNNYITSIGLDWTITPNIINQLRGGYYYNAYWYGVGSKPIWAPPSNTPQVSWAYGFSGQTFTLPVTTYYPIINVVDNAAWTHRNHTISFGFDFYREQDHYWNPPDGINNITLGLNSADPARGWFDSYLNSIGMNPTDRGNAEALYATLVGRVTRVSPIGSGFPYDAKSTQYAQNAGQAYNLDELQKGWGLYAQDSFRVTPHLTANYGLRWDFTGDDHDLTGAYHGADPSGVYGPSGVGNVFKPGTLTGDMNPAYVARSHQYNAWNVSPQPTIGLAWNPSYSQGFLSKLMGGNDTVIRAGFDIKRFTEPYQYFWNNASNHGMAFFQYYNLAATGVPGPGQFQAGSITLADPNNPILPHDPRFTYTPTAYSASIPESVYTWNYGWGAAGIDPHIKQPYVMEWNLGIQRALGRSNVLEVRYVGHRSVHQWMQTNPNEVNIFENGFLKEFKNAQQNLAIYQQANPGCVAAGNCSFANNGLPGQVALPIFNAAFACPPGACGSGVTAGQDYTNTAFTIPLSQGAAGAVASTLSLPFGASPGVAPYICNLVGSALSPCTASYGYTAPGPYPVNFFQANPLGNGGGTESWQVAQAYGNYHALQVDFRQRAWHGLQFDMNYTWSHTLGLQPENYQGAAAAWLGATNVFTIRNLRLNYGPTTFDLRHVVHGSGTYDLPFGKGKAFLNQPGVLDKIVGGWTVGTIVLLQTGAPFQLFGGYNTFNDSADGGLLLNGVTRSQLQNAIGVYPIAGANYVSIINPKLLTGNTSTNCNSVVAGICQNTTPGTFGTNPWLYGPHIWNADMSLAKAVPITERVRFTFQVEALNVFNHTNFTIPGGGPFGFGSGNVTSSAFGQAGTLCLRCSLSSPDPNYGARLLELRANISF